MCIITHTHKLCLGFSTLNLNESSFCLHTRQLMMDRGTNSSPCFSYGYILRLNSGKKKKKGIVCCLYQGRLNDEISASKREMFLLRGKIITEEAHSSPDEGKHVMTKLLGNEKSGQSYGTFNQKISKQSHTVINKACHHRMQSGKCIHRETKVEKGQAN